VKVLKFGGSSLADAFRIQKVAEIILSEVKSGPFALVLSAMKGMTNKLIHAAELAEQGNHDYHNILREIKQTHDNAVKNLFSEQNTKIVRHDLEQLHKELEDFLHGVELIRECTPRILDLVMSFGERLSCTLVTHYLKERGVDALLIDARKIIVTDDMYGKASVDYEETYTRIKKLLTGMKKLPVITGFIAATKNEVTTTLGRNGSDYTASLIGAGLSAEAIEIWTDVNGVLSADPRYVKNAFTIHELSYEEAMELSYFGAEVIHPNTMIPAVERNIPIIIKNTFHPHEAGTIIKNKIKAHEAAISGIACIENIALLNIEGGGMVGIPGMAARIFSILAAAALNIIMISQGSSEHSICLGLKQNEALKAVEALKKELKRELESKIINEFLPIKELVIIAVIGDNMKGTPGISGKLFSALGEEHINVLAIAQGSSERNISFVIHNKDRVRALNTIHKAFFNKHAMRK
jgi:aspartokinase/homoserine dehydrogenase 1